MESTLRSLSGPMTGLLSNEPSRGAGLLLGHDWICKGIGVLSEVENTQKVPYIE